MLPPRLLSLVTQLMTLVLVRLCRWTYRCRSQSSSVYVGSLDDGNGGLDVLSASSTGCSGRLRFDAKMEITANDNERTPPLRPTRALSPCLQAPPPQPLLNAVCQVHQAVPPRMLAPPRAGQRVHAVFSRRRPGRAAGAPNTIKLTLRNRLYHTATQRTPWPRTGRDLEKKVQFFECTIYGDAHKFKNSKKSSRAIGADPSHSSRPPPTNNKMSG